MTVSEMNSAFTVYEIIRKGTAEGGSQVNVGRVSLTRWISDYSSDLSPGVHYSYWIRGSTEMPAIHT